MTMLVDKIKGFAKVEIKWVCLGVFDEIHDKVAVDKEVGQFGPSPEEVMLLLNKIIRKSGWEMNFVNNIKYGNKTLVQNLVLWK